MPRAGRPPLTEEVLQERIRDYCARYGVHERNAEGFPAYPAGRRESPQHREWVVLFKAHQRVRARARTSAGAASVQAASGDASEGLCPVCLQDDPVAASHNRCRDLIAAVRALGPEGFERLRRVAFEPGPAGGQPL